MSIHRSRTRLFSFLKLKWRRIFVRKRFIPAPNPNPNPNPNWKELCEKALHCGFQNAHGDPVRKGAMGKYFCCRTDNEGVGPICGPFNGILTEKHPNIMHVHKETIDEENGDILVYNLTYDYFLQCHDCQEMEKNDHVLHDSKSTTTNGEGANVLLGEYDRFYCQRWQKLMCSCGKCTDEDHEGFCGLGHRVRPDQDREEFPISVKKMRGCQCRSCFELDAALLYPFHDLEVHPLRHDHLEPILNSS